MRDGRVDSMGQVGTCGRIPMQSRISDRGARQFGRKSGEVEGSRVSYLHEYAIEPAFVGNL
jgi:hypothetical protein